MDLEPNLGVALDISAKLALATPKTCLLSFSSAMLLSRDHGLATGLLSSQKLQSYCILISAPAPCSGLQGDSRDSVVPESAATARHANMPIAGAQDLQSTSTATTRARKERGISLPFLFSDIVELATIVAVANI
jgi:hypothetical protein